MWTRREFAGIGASALAFGAAIQQGIAAFDAEKIVVDLFKEIGPLDPIWKRCGGSDRAEITMRDEWRRDARRMKSEVGLERVRFHGVFDDEMGVWPKFNLASPTQPNFVNVDSVYDGLLDLELRPFIEMSFIPSKLGSGAQTFGLYKGNITPPKSLDDWGGFVRTFAQHLLDRYGTDEVRQWYFEVWNEANLSFFWTGTQAQYFDLYRATAAALKSVDASLKVGGPSTSAVQWIAEFLDFCNKAGSAVDFVSTHVYAGDEQKMVFGRDVHMSHNEVIPAAVKQVRGQIDASKFKGTELWLSEWSSDSPAMICHVISHCLANCQGMSHWEFSGTYEEILVPNAVLTDGDAGWSLFAPRNIPKPGFNTYKLMNRLGARRLRATGPALASRTVDGGIAVLVWNLAEVTQARGIPGVSRVRKVIGEVKKLAVSFRGAKPGQAVKVSYVDQERGSPMPTWHAMGRPQYPTRTQLAELRTAAEIAAPVTIKLDARGSLTLELPPEGIALLEMGREA